MGANAGLNPRLFQSFFEYESLRARFCAWASVAFRTPSELAFWKFWCHLCARSSFVLVSTGSFPVLSTGATCAPDRGACRRYLALFLCCALWALGAGTT